MQNSEHFLEFSNLVESCFNSFSLKTDFLPQNFQFFNLDECRRY